MAEKPKYEKWWPEKIEDSLKKVKDKGKAAFKVAKDSSLGKGFISAYNNVIGKEFGMIDGGTPDGVHSGAKGRGRALKSAAKPDQTKARAVKADQPFTIVSAGGSQYYTDVQPSESYTPKGSESKSNTGTDEKKNGPTVPSLNRPYSHFNNYSLINYKGTPLEGESNGFESNGAGGTIYQKINVGRLVNPTVTQIIEITGSKTGNMGYRYNYSDFALARYFNKIPNSYLITLRRFAYPAADDIISPKQMGEDGKMVELMQPDIARAVTWLGEAPGNSMSEILKFSHGFGWKEAESEMQTITSPSREASAGKFGSMVNNSKIMSAMANGAAGRGAVESNARDQNADYDQFSNTYPNHVFGPLNVIKQVLIREQGLNFSQEFSIKFEYELRSFEGANPKLMMLDQLSNLLALTFNNAPFWGGSVRYIGGGGGAAKPLGNLNKLKSGDYLGFAGSVVEDMGKLFGGALKGGGNAFDSLLKGDVKGALGALKDNKMINNLIGGPAMEMFNTPQGAQAAASLLTGDPTGNWHLTIGNPLDPIVVIGNLCMTDCEITFEGANAVQDFPERLVAVIKLKPGRPRDKAEIESMFNAGRGRFYLQPDDVADINKTTDVSAYGNKDRKVAKGDFINVFRKVSNG
jgi:hypothetical protein